MDHPFFGLLVRNPPIEHCICVLHGCLRCLAYPGLGITLGSGTVVYDGMYVVEHYLFFDM